MWLLLLSALGCLQDKSAPTIDDSATTGASQSEVAEDTACDPLTWYQDSDGDGFGASADPVESCEAGEGLVANADDCDDTDAGVHPEAPERCDLIDNDCDGEIDEGVGEAWYEDVDGDGYGDPLAAHQLCEVASGLVDNGLDCDDSDPEIHPAATEICDLVDNDCDGEIDEDGGDTWYSDSDYDGYGDPDSAETACDQPAGTVSNSDDCDDATAASYPGARDGCDGEDNDCDGLVDEDWKDGWLLVTLHEGVAWQIDPATGAITELVELTGSDAVDPTSSDVSEAGLAVYHTNEDYSIKELDICSGAVTDIGPTGAGKCGAIAFGPSGLLYGLDQNADVLMTLDTTTGAASTVGPLGHNTGNTGIAYDCADDRLLVIDATTDTLYEVNPTTGALTTVAALSVNFSTVGLEYDAVDGLLWASTGRAFYTIDPHTGAATKVADWDGFTGLNDLALFPSCP